MRVALCELGVQKRSHLILGHHRESRQPVIVIIQLGQIRQLEFMVKQDVAKPFEMLGAGVFIKIRSRGLAGFRKGHVHNSVK